MRDPAGLVGAVRRYRALELEHAALRVVGRGLFLAIMLMVVFLYVFARATDVVSGVNEVAIPTTSVSEDLDLGALARGAFTRTSASVVSIIGVVTLLISAVLTGHACRDGTRRALLGDGAGRTRLLSRGTLAVALVLAGVVLTTWLLTLATSIRYQAWVTLLGRDISEAGVIVGKVVAIALALALVAGSCLVTVRLVRGRTSARSITGSIVLAIVVVGANFFLLYTYVGALINPAVSAGIVLILTLLLWVNITVRGYLLALSWVAADAQSSH